MHHNLTDNNAARASWLSRAVSGWNEFWFTPADSIGLHVARTVFGLVLLTNLIGLWGQAHPLLGLDGWVDRQAYVEGARIDAGHPNLTGWSPLFAAGSGIALTIVYALAVASVALFTLGIATRITGVLTWLAAVAYTTNPAASFGGDAVLLVFSLYMMVGYLFMGLRQPWNLQVLLGNWGWDLKGQGHLSVAARTTLRLMQIHLAVILFTSGVHKLQIGGWWAGVPLWFPLHPAFETNLENLNIQSPGTYMVLLSLAAYAVLAWQISFPFMAWRKGFRPLLVGGGIVAAIASPLLYGMPLFGGLTLTGCLAFVAPAAYRALAARFGWTKENHTQPVVSQHSSVAIKSVA